MSLLFFTFRRVQRDVANREMFSLTLVQMALKMDVAVQLGVIYDSPGNQLERGMRDVMPRWSSEAPCLHLERARDCEGGSGTAWCA
jgi:hypothetical protein